MKIRTTVTLVISAASAAVVAVAAAVGVLAGPGCAGNCGTGCPSGQVDLFTALGEDFPFNSALQSGPACVPGPIPCRGDQTRSCARFTIIGIAEGTCQLVIDLADRPPLTVTATFGPAGQQGCCGGFPVIGDSVVILPPKNGPDGGGDGGDGSGDSDASAPDGGAADGG